MSEENATPPPIAPTETQSQPIGQNGAVRILLPVGRSGWAIAAGYLGLFGLLIVPAPLALGASLLALRDIRRSKGSVQRKHGTGRAIFGLTVGTIGTIILIVVIIGIARDM